MEDESVNFIRKSTRNLLNLKRRNNRVEESDRRRCVPTSSVDRETVADISNKLKTKSAITVEELRKLKNSLLDDEANVNVVLSTHGALRGLVRELSGHDVNKQVEAAGCCCNLSLGDERGCLVIGRAAASYLVICLDSLSSELAVTCAWSIGNLAASGSKVCELLVAQGAIAKLTSVLNANSNNDLTDAVLYAVQHLVYHRKGELRSENIHNLLQALCKFAITITSSRILFMLSCHPSFTSMNVVDQVFLQRLLEHLPVSMKTHIYCDGKENCCDFLFLVRLLANTCVEAHVCDIVVNYLVSNDVHLGFKNIILLNNETINKSVMWFLGNLINISSDSVDKSKLFDVFL